MILYRHFESKADLYRAALDRACTRLAAAVGTDTFDEGSVAALVRAADDDPDGFGLLFRHAKREPEFRDVIDALSAVSTDIARRTLSGRLPDDPWLEWASRLVPVVTIEAVLAWLDAGRPDPDLARERIGDVIDGVLAAIAP